MNQMNGIKKTIHTHIKKDDFMKFLATLVTLLATSNVFAQGAPAEGNPLFQFLPLVLVFVVFYFLMLRPQQKRMKEEQDMIAKLAKGDEVYTKSGLIGTIYGLNDKVVTLDMGDGVKLKVVRSQIGGLAKSILENKETK